MSKSSLEDTSPSVVLFQPSEMRREVMVMEMLEVFFCGGTAILS